MTEMDYDSIFKKFSDTFNENDDLKLASENDICILESEFNILVPEDYKAFLLHYGNLWTPDILDLIVDNELELNDVQNFWVIEKIIYDKKHEWTSQLIVDFMPIASDCMGSIFGFLSPHLRVKKASSPIYFFDHDFDTIEKKADSFTSWISMFNGIKKEL